ARPSSGPNRAPPEPRPVPAWGDRAHWEPPRAGDRAQLLYAGRLRGHDLEASMGLRAAAEDGHERDLREAVADPRARMARLGPRDPPRRPARRPMRQARRRLPPPARAARY